MSDFVKALQDAQQLPAGTETSPYDPFAAKPQKGSKIAETASGAAAIPGSTAYNMDYYACRFYMGRELQEVTEEGAKIYTNRDEAEQLQEVMTKVLAGEAVIIEKLKTILSDGSIVIWLEWMVKKEKKKLSTADGERALTEGELRSPKRITPRSEEQDDKSDSAMKAAAIQMAKEAGLPLYDGDDEDPTLNFSADDDGDNPASEAANKEPDWS